MKKVLLFILLALPAFAGREFAGTSSQLGVCTIDPISPPLTFAFWFRAANVTDTHVVMALNTTTNTYELVTLAFNGAGAGDPIGMSLVTAANSTMPTLNGSTFVASTWYHAVGILESSTSRRTYRNGTQIASTNSSYTVNGFNNVYLATRQYNGSYAGYATGAIAEAAVWDVALTDAEVLSLSVGASPFLIRPASLKFYAPLTGREAASEWNLVGAAVSLTNAPAASANHPRIYNP